MRLIKFCLPEHRLPASPSLLIGTLHAYRSFEERLEEGQEGHYDFELEVKGPLRVPSDLYLMLTGQPGARPLPGGVTVQIDKALATDAGDGTHKVEALKGRIQRNVANSFLLCLSMGDPGMVTPWKTYTASWQAPVEAAQQIAVAISREIERSVRSALMGPAPVARSAAPSPKVRYTGGAMIYAKRRITFDSKSPLTQDSLNRELFRMPFIKPPALAAEREFRMVFECIVGKKIYSPGKDGLLVASAPLAPFLLH